MSELKDMYGITQEDYDQAKKDIQEKKPLFIHGLDTLAKQLAIARSEKKALELITYLMKTQTYYKRSAERVYLELSLEKELMETRTDQYPEESLVHEKYENYVNAIVALRKHGLEFEANQIVERLKNQLPPSP
jgi:LPS O-antigen subunit length determinant protein (WzzB/FepE family)